MKPPPEFRISSLWTFDVKSEYDSTFSFFQGPSEATVEKNSAFGIPIELLGSLVSGFLFHGLWINPEKSLGSFSSPILP